MRRLIFHFAVLVLTFVIGTFVNAQVNRAAYYFIPDYDPQPVVHYDPVAKARVETGCGPAHLDDVPTRDSRRHRH